MDALQERYENGEIDKWDFYYGIISMNNQLLADALGRGMEEYPNEDAPALGDDYLINRPIAMHLKRLQGEYPELVNCQEEDEAVEGNKTIKQRLAETGGVRDDISAFIAAPMVDEERPEKQFYPHELKGIQNLLLSDKKGLRHPLGLALGPSIEVAQENILPAPKRELTPEEIAERANRARTRRGKIIDPSFQTEQDEAAQRQREMLDTMFRQPDKTLEERRRESVGDIRVVEPGEERSSRLEDAKRERIRDPFADARRQYSEEVGDKAADDYKRFFEEVDMDQRGPQDVSAITLRKPKSSKVEALVRAIQANAINMVDTEENLDSASRNDALIASFNDMQSKFNEFMTAMTGNPFGTSGRAGRFGGEITAGRTPDALTPSLREAGKQLGIALPVARIPDLMLTPFLSARGNTPAEQQQNRLRMAFDARLIEDLTNQLADLTDTTNFHPSLMNAMSGGGVLDPLKDDPQAALPDTAVAGTEEERAGKGAEAARGDAPGSTEAGIRDPLAAGGELTRQKQARYERQLAKIERMKKHGVLSEEDYQMQLQAAALNRQNDSEEDDKHRIDEFKELGGLSGNDFDVGHPLHGLSEGNILRTTDDFVSNLIGMGRLLSDLRYLAYYEQDAQTNKDRSKVDEEMKGLNLTASDLLNFDNPETPFDRLRYQALDNLLGGNARKHMNRLNSQMNRRMSRMKALFSDDDPNWQINLLNAAMRYTNADMSMEGYIDAFKYLSRQVSKKGGLKSYPATRLLQYLEKKGRRDALNEEHQFKVNEQQMRWKNHNLARQNMDDDGEVSQEHADHLLHEDEECVACHPDRFGNRTAEEAYIHSPYRRQKSAYAYKQMTMPLFDVYQQGGRELPMKLIGDEGDRTSLLKILQHIYPEEDEFNTSRVKARRERVVNDRNRRVDDWEARTSARYRALIKNAVASGNPRAQTIFKQFGLYKAAENSIAAGSAGMNSKQLAALSFFLNDDEAYDSAHEKSRVRNLMATRMDALDTALSMIDAISKGELGDKKYAPNSLQDEATRKAIAVELFKKPQSQIRTTRNLMKKLDEEKEFITSNKAWRTYTRDIDELKRAEAGLKPVKETDELGVEREYPGPYDNKQGRAQIEQMKSDFTTKYGGLEKQLKSVNTRTKNAKEKLRTQLAASREALAQTNQYALGAFIKAGPQLLTAFGMEDRDDQLDMLAEIMDDLYGEEEDIVYTAQSNGNVLRSDMHKIDKYKDSRLPLGKIGEMAGTNIRYFNNNLAVPIVDDINTLKAHRAKMGFPLTQEQEERAKGLMHDAEMAEHIDKEAMARIQHMMPSIPEELINHAETPQVHHDAEPNEAGQLTEAEMRKRHHNSHFTRGAEEAILRGDFELMPIEKLQSNWRQHAPTMCGTCHGTGHVSRDEAVAYLRHHVPELKDQTKGSAVMNKYITNNLRPRDTPSFDDHEHADIMHADDHEQLACPDCEHDDPGVVGGKISNGICSHCFGHGQRFTDDDEHIQEAKKSHHYGATSHGFDILNNMFGQLFDARMRDDMPEFLREMMPPIRLASQVYRDALEQGQYISHRQLMDARKRQHEPLSMDDDVPAITGSPKPKPKLDFGGAKEDDLPNPMERLSEIRESAGLEDPRTAPKATLAPTEEPIEQSLRQLQFGQTHNKFMDAHQQAALRERVMILSKMIEGYLNKANLPADQHNAIVEDAQEYIDNLLQPDGHLMHNDDTHSLNSDLQSLQELAELNFTVEPDEKGRMPKGQLPVDESGGLSMGVADVFGGNLPMKFQHYPPLMFYHGRFLTPTEINEGLFDPKRTNAQPRDIHLEDMKDFFSNNSEARRLIALKERQQMTEDPKIIKPIAEAIQGLEKKPMVMKKRVGLYHSGLDDLVKRLGLTSENYDMPEEGLAFSDEFEKALKDNDAKKVNDVLSHSEKGVTRKLDNDYTQKLNRQIRAMYLDYAKLKGLEIFLADHANPLDHPFIPEGLTMEGYAQQKESLPLELMMDEVAKLYGFADEQEMELGSKQRKKLTMVSKHTIPRGNRDDFVLDPRAFKREVLENSRDEEGEQMDFSRAQYGKDADGNITTTIVPVDIMTKLQPAEVMSEIDGKKFDTMLNMMRYHLRPNWSMQEDLTKLMQQQEGADGGFDNYEELQRAYKEGALPDDVMKKLTDMKTMSAFAHPTLRPHNYDTMAHYDYANKAMNGRQVAADFDARNEAARAALSQMGARQPQGPITMEDIATEYGRRFHQRRDLQEGMEAFPPYQPQMLASAGVPPAEEPYQPQAHQITGFFQRLGEDDSQ